MTTDQNTAAEADADTVANRAAQVITRMGADIRALTGERDRYRTAWRSARERAQAYGEGILRVVKDREQYQEWLRQAEERAAAAPVPPPADRAALRQRIATAVERLHETGGIYALDTGEAERIADAVLAVLPEPTDQTAVPSCICGHPEQQHFEDVCQACDCGDYLTPDAARDVIGRWREAAIGKTADRAAALREAADFYERVLEQSLDPGSDPRYCNAVRDIVMGLRRRAAEEQPAAGCWCGHPQDRHWAGSTRMTFPDGCHDCRGWNGAHAYGQELPWADDEPDTVRPAVGEQPETQETP